ncbi:MAG: glycosyltransferase family 2 protein [Treponema sp.]|nr:glycosyltransferase family 2 protein [Treponema sp.]
MIPAVFEHCPLETNILVVDDNSPDGTAAIVERLITENKDRLHILKRSGKQGLAGAYLIAFDWGLSKEYDVFLEMDADFSHNPKYIPEMVNNIQDHDVVIGSRNVKKGGVEGWSFLRNCISKGGSLYSQIILGCPIKDLTGGFNMWTNNAFQKIDLQKIISKGYSFQVEMKYRAWYAGCSVKEIPILFTDRKFGASKMSKKIFFEAFINIWKIKKNAGGDTILDQFIKFFITGGLGTITNLAIFFLCADILKLPEILVSIGCFVIAGTQNYIVNHRWSFTSSTGTSKLSLKKWCLFLGTSLAGLAINIAVMKLMILNFNIPYKFIAQACGIAAGMVVNFMFSKYMVFRNKEAKI